MPAKSTIKKAKKDLRQGKSPSTAAGEFVHEEIEHVRRGKHGARSPKQAIAIGLSKARRAGVPLKPPKRGQAKETTRRSAERDYRKGQTSAERKTSRRPSSARKSALKREPRNTASHEALSKQARSAAKRRRFSSDTGGSRTAGRKRAATKATKSSARSTPSQRHKKKAA